MNQESPLNNPTHPCQFCALPVPIGTDYCNKKCFTADEILRTFLDTTEDMASKPFWWCNSHQREATHIDKRGEHVCDPHLPGILLACRVVDLTGIAIIEEKKPNPDWRDATPEEQARGNWFIIDSTCWEKSFNANA